MTVINMQFAVWSEFWSPFAARRVRTLRLRTEALVEAGKTLKELTPEFIEECRHFSEVTAEIAARATVLRVKPQH